MLYSVKQQKSLKEIEILLHMPNVQEYEGSFDLQIQECDIDTMIEYNVNDVEATETLLNKVKEDVELRLEVEKNGGLMHCR